MYNSDYEKLRRLDEKSRNAAMALDLERSVGFIIELRNNIAFMVRREADAAGNNRDDREILAYAARNCAKSPLVRRKKGGPEDPEGYAYALVGVQTVKKNLCAFMEELFPGFRSAPQRGFFTLCYAHRLQEVIDFLTNEKDICICLRRPFRSSMAG